MRHGVQWPEPTLQWPEGKLIACTFRVVAAIRLRRAHNHLSLRRRMARSL
jgi:hypothetical protein